MLQQKLKINEECGPLAKIEGTALFFLDYIIVATNHKSYQAIYGSLSLCETLAQYLQLFREAG